MPCDDEGGQEIGSFAKRDPGRFHPDPLDVLTGSPGPVQIGLVSPLTGMAVHGVFLKSSVIHLSIVQSTLPCQEGRMLLHKKEYQQDLHNGAGPAPLPSSRCGKGLRMVLWCSCIASRQKHLSGILCKYKIARQRLEIKGEL